MLKVSIHAPVMGATSFAERVINPVSVSIHAPVMGATYGTHNYIANKYRFNPRTRDGCDAILLSDPCVSDVSIHAPVMGATTQPINQCL